MCEEINFPARFVLDEHFINDILKDKKKAGDILWKLNFVHKSSKHHPLTHNRMFDESFMNSIKDKQIRGPALLGVVSPEPCPVAFLNEKDFESRVIRHAINMATKRPYEVIILTSKEQAMKYASNKHYSDEAVKASVKIVFEDRALQLIDVVHNFRG